MRKRFIELTSGWIPVSVLLLFAVVLVAGQASANLPTDIRAVAPTGIASPADPVLHGELVLKLERAWLLADKVLLLPEGIGLVIDMAPFSAGGDTESVGPHTVE